MATSCAIRCNTVAALGCDGARTNKGRVPMVKGLAGSSVRRSTRVNSLPRKLFHLALEMGNGGIGGGNFSGGNNGGNNWGNNGDDSSGDDHRPLLGAAVAVPMYDLAANMKMEKVLLQIITLIAAIFLPVLGVYLHRRTFDRAFWLAVPLTFLPPLGSLFALYVIFGNPQFVDKRRS
uniref:Uncharacterized protein n=1 Tax=Pyramimonas obovata TaxID=1411642 RepID=A0A7S0R0B5_9CHLO|eukprot:CAMPEP_0118933258 /NCGR_PEP_ID=MMETSP1169-20130426/11834_1 /TAXON_ID=36882 /ORGANISM="Pyramimonas obovata, Strain CCMP722" /LENGTH=176 /DNA_ID=CAMNT_0006875997 /DNA_START=42 /DNA_END=572 /DNA_ORIENTATION=+